MFSILMSFILHPIHESIALQVVFRHDKDGTLAKHFLKETKLKHFFHVSLMFALLSCVHNQPSRIKSGWHPLTKAKAIDCAAWPLREKDLKVDAIVPFYSDHPGFFVTLTKRDTSRGHYFAPLGEEIIPNSEGFLPIPLPRGSHLLGGTRVGGKAQAIVLSVATNQVDIELRPLPFALVEQRIPVPIKGFERGQVIPGAHGDWILLEDDDGRHRVFFLGVNTKGQRLLRDLGVELEERPKAVFAREGLLLSFRSSKEPRLLRTIWIGEGDSANPRPSAPRLSTVDVGDNIEAWNVVASPLGVIFAGIVGDSLVGDAKMHVGKLDLSNKNGKLQLIAKAGLRDIHVTEPVLVANSQGAEILLVNWVDEESTIARYIVNAEGLSAPVFSGLFVNGVHIVGQLAIKDARQVRVLTRHRIESRWVYQICGL